MDEPITILEIRNALRAKRFAHANEAELESGVEEVLAEMGLPVRRQVRLGPRERIDVTTELPRGDRAAIRVGIEIKIKGPADAARRQLVRYAGHEEVDALLLVTTMYRHMAEIMPHATDCPRDHDAGARWLLSGKPFELVLLDRGLL